MWAKRWRRWVEVNSPWRIWRKQKPKPAPTPAPAPTPKPTPKPAPKLPIQGCDYVSGPTPAQLKAAGMHFVCRYIAPAGTVFDWKRLSTAEAAALHKAGLPIVLVFESSASRATSGAAGGVSDAKAAVAELDRLGAKNVPVYFACDFDVPDYAPKLANATGNAVKKLGPVAAYFTAINGVLGRGRTGVYGGYWVVKRLFDADLVKWGWQTYAWSAGKWDKRAQLQQYDNGGHLGGHSVDLDRAVQYPFGAW